MKGMLEHDLEFLYLLIDHLKIASKQGDVYLVPKLKFDIGIVYEIGDFLVQASRLSTLNEKGFLEKVASSTFPTCKICDDVSLMLEVRCPFCMDNNLIKTDLMTHYECGYTGPVGSFPEMGDSKYLCPKCKRKITRVGIDYGRPGVGFKCFRCGESYQFPLYLLKCSKGHQQRVDEINLKSYPVYRVSKRIIQFKDTLVIAEKIRDYLMSMGIDAGVLHKITGKSQATHLIPIFIDTTPPICVDFILDDEDAKDQLMAVIVKSLDVDAYFIVATFTEVEPSLASVVNPEKIKLVSVKRDNAVEVILKEIEEAMAKDVKH